MSGTVTTFDMVNTDGYSMAKYLKRQSYIETQPLIILYSNRMTKIYKESEKDLIEFSLKSDKMNRNGLY